MSEQDDADVIEQASRQFSFPAVPGMASVRGIAGTRRRRLVVIAAAGALLVTAATLVTVRLAAGSRTDPALAGLIREVTTVPLGTSVPSLPTSDLPAIPYSSTLTPGAGVITAVSGQPLTRGGKPEVLYVATGYCPYCAMENWPLIVALSRFGQFTGLTTSRSPEFEHIAPIDSWTFYGSHYASLYLSFVPVEQYSNVLVNAKANPEARESYRKLQQLTPAQQVLFARYDKIRATPFLDFGNQAVQAGSGLIPAQLMTGRSWRQLAAALRQPGTDLGSALLAEADSLTAGLCRLTGDRPAAACPAFITSIQPPS
ncbi:MAG: DUF929 family protein [Streptosporangiaceae bacterium]|jgi:hypothetical protein